MTKMSIQTRGACLKLCWAKRLRRVQPPANEQFLLWAPIYNNGVVRKRNAHLARKHGRLQGEVDAAGRAVCIRRDEPSQPRTSAKNATKSGHE